jgi:hypothetical protein
MRRLRLALRSLVDAYERRDMSGMKQPIRGADLLRAIEESEAALEKRLAAIETILQRQSAMLADQAAVAGEHSAILTVIERRLGSPPA